MDCAQPPFSNATLVAFRQRLIAHEGDRRLVERTLEVAQASGLFSPTALRVALDSSPLWGAGQVEDTYNLLLGQWQKRRARYCGQRKNLFDRRRCAVVDTLHVVSRLQAQAQQAT